LAEAQVDPAAYSLGAEEAAKLRRAEEEFHSRPHLSIRLRIVAGFILCFFLTGVAAPVTLAILYQARAKLRLLEVTHKLVSELEQAGSLALEAHGAGLREAWSHAVMACALFQAESVVLLDVGGEGKLTELSGHLLRYRDLLEDGLKAEEAGSLGVGGASAASPATGGSLPAALRSEREASLTLLKDLSKRETAAVDRMLTITQIVPFVTLALLLLIIFWVTRLLSQTITRALIRFQGYTQRIASGNFEPIRPARPYHDELSDLALAVNRMLFELRGREVQAIRAGKLAAVGTFTTGIAHELNNPINNISITTELLMDECGEMRDERKVRLLEDIYRETQRADEIVRGLLDFTRQEPPEFAAVDLLELVRSAEKLVQNEASVHNVTCELHLPEAFPPIRGSFSQLNQVLVNLLLNAIQAMPSGGTLRVSARRLDPARACVDISDEGVGIAPENLPRVFDPFFTTKERGKGAGLGLSLSYSIIQRHGGDIQVESAPGAGTTVRLQLPLAEEQRQGPKGGRP